MPTGFSLGLSLINNIYTITTVSVLIVVWLVRIIYSINFSPLSKIPSPWLYQFFPWYYYLTLGRGSAPFILDGLHKRYGPIFRVGWKVVIVATPEACTTIYASYKFTKGEYYKSFNYFGENLLSDRTTEGHKLRKRLVAPAFTKANVKLMEPTIIDVGLKPLLTNLENHIKLNKPVDLFRQFHYMSWDTIGELGFGQSFNMLQTGDHPAAGWLTTTLTTVMLYNIIPLLSKFKVPAGEKLWRFNEEVLNKYYEKLNEGKAENSLLRFLVNARDKVTGNKLSRSEIFAETSLMLAAGTDTTSNSLTLIFHLLMRYPEVDIKLSEELNNIDEEIITNDIFLDKCPYLNAVIQEAMRLLPAVPGAILRTIPNEGITLSGHFLPGGIEVGVPIYAIQRSELIWPKADEFIPERWLETDPQAELYVTTEMKKCILPYLAGPSACVGKNLANLTINLITANLLKHYKFISPKSELISNNENDMTMIAIPVAQPQSSKLLATLVPRHQKPQIISKN